MSSKIDPISPKQSRRDVPDWSSNCNAYMQHFKLLSNFELFFRIFKENPLQKEAVYCATAIFFEKFCAIELYTTFLSPEVWTVLC